MTRSGGGGCFEGDDFRFQFFDVQNSPLRSTILILSQLHIRGTDLENLKLMQSTPTRFFLLTIDFLPPLPPSLLRPRLLPLSLLPTMRHHLFQTRQALINLFPPPSFDERMRNLAIRLRTRRRRLSVRRISIERGQFAFGNGFRDGRLATRSFSRRDFLLLQRVFRRGDGDAWRGGRGGGLGSGETGCARRWCKRLGYARVRFHLFRVGIGEGSTDVRIDESSLVQLVDIMRRKITSFRCVAQSPPPKARRRSSRRRTIVILIPLLAQ